MGKKRGVEPSQKSIGERLREKREEKKLTLQEVSEKLCITKSNLKRLEEQSEQINPDVYTIGFIRTYAEYLGLDASGIIQEFKDLAPTNQQDESDLSFPTALPQEGIPKIKILAISAVLALVVAFGINQFTSAPEILPHKTEEASLTVIEEAPSHEATTEERKAEFSSVPVALSDGKSDEPKSALNVASGDALSEIPSEDSQDKVTLFAIEDSWVEVRNPIGDVIVSRVFHPGEIQDFEIKDDLILHTGNAGGLQLTVGEHTTQPLGHSGEVKNNLSLKPKKILADFPENR